ncbi:MAG: hypothetical protein MUC85_09595, partial [Anaerolineales bacterium]|nr:hypothetical protein [Anaerolineales bacterium]
FLEQRKPGDDMDLFRRSLNGLGELAGIPDPQALLYSIKVVKSIYHLTIYAKYLNISAVHLTHKQ